MWCVIIGYIVTASIYSRDRRAEITVKELRVDIVDTSAIKTVSHAKVARWLREGGIDPVGQSVNEAATLTRTIEEYLAARPEVRHVSARTDLEGVLTVRIEQRTPLMRVRTENGYRFWFTTDGFILPDTGDIAAHVPVVTGNIPFPFSTPPSHSHSSPPSQGSYADLQRANYNDFLERFTALEDERRSLSSQLSATRSGIRAVQSKGPKRLWSRVRKKAFNDERAARLVELRKQAAGLEAQLVRLKSQKSVLAEKEKKSYQSHRFLSKLANFVESIGRDDFWSAGIVQINAAGVNTKSWKEPQLELIPRVGDHVVLLGELDGGEMERLEKLRLFYTRGLRHEGWDKYDYIDIKYKDQIVCK